MMDSGHKEELDLDAILGELDTLHVRITYLEEQIADFSEWGEESSEKRIYGQRILLEQLTDARKRERQYLQLLENLPP